MMGKITGESVWLVTKLPPIASCQPEPGEKGDGVNWISLLARQ